MVRSRLQTSLEKFELRVHVASHPKIFSLFGLNFFHRRGGDTHVTFHSWDGDWQERPLLFLAVSVVRSTPGLRMCELHNEHGEEEVGKRFPQALPINT